MSKQENPVTLKQLSLQFGRSIGKTKAVLAFGHLNDSDSGAISFNSGRGTIHLYPPSTLDRLREIAPEYDAMIAAERVKTARRMQRFATTPEARNKANLTRFGRPTKVAKGVKGPKASHAGESAFARGAIGAVTRFRLKELNEKVAEIHEMVTYLRAEARAPQIERRLGSEDCEPESTVFSTQAHS